MRLEGKVALITGGGSGMGKVASELFAREGARVVLTDVNDEAGRATASAIGNDAHYVHADVSREADAQAMVADAVERFGRLDVLYNNAGVMLPDDGSVDSTDETIWDTTLAVNVKGVAFGCKYGIPAMLGHGGGSIINVASFVAWMGAATSQTAYTASKGAQEAMARALAVELAPRGIRARLRPPVVRRGRTRRAERERSPRCSVPDKGGKACRQVPDQKCCRSLALRRPIPYAAFSGRSPAPSDSD